MDQAGLGPCLVPQLLVIDSTSGAGHRTSQLVLGLGVPQGAEHCPLSGGDPYLGTAALTCAWPAGDHGLRHLPLGCWWWRQCPQAPAAAAPGCSSGEVKRTRWGRALGTRLSLLVEAERTILGDHGQWGRGEATSSLQLPPPGWVELGCSQRLWRKAEETETGGGQREGAAVGRGREGPQAGDARWHHRASQADRGQGWERR